MPQLVKKDIRFDSADGKTSAAAFLYTGAEVRPFCVLQISHGMCEMMSRYEETAAYFAARGVAVCGNDHLGHGETAKTEADLGYFGEDGRNFLLEDMKTMNALARSHFPGLPVVLLGHSMGSFFAREYPIKWPETIDGLIISGTGGKNPLVDVGITLTTVLSAVKKDGTHARSNFVDKLAFGAYLKRISHPKTVYDWLSRDEAVVDAFVADPKCTFRFTLNGYKELFLMLKEVTGPEWAAQMPKDLPTLLISGGEDPVSGYGEGAKQVEGWLREAGVRDLAGKVYPGARHEVLNETNRAEVYADVLVFAERVCGQPARLADDPTQAPEP